MHAFTAMALYSQEDKRMDHGLHWTFVSKKRITGFGNGAASIQKAFGSETVTSSLLKPFY